MSNNDQFGTGLFCFAVGAAVGSCIAMLYAPQSGRRTRQKLLRTAEEMQDRAVDKGHEIGERGREIYERGAKLAEQAVGR